MAAKDKISLILLLLFNFLILVAGIVIVVGAFIIKFGSGLLEKEVTTLLNKISYNNVQLGTLADAVAYIMIIGGFFIISIALLGMCGAWHDIRGCLWAYIIIIVCLILLQMVLMALWIFLRNTADEWLKGKMLELIEDYDGPEEEDEVSKGFNTLFMKMKCCGVNAEYKNGGSNNDFNERGTKWWSKRGSDNVPATCCQGVTNNSIKNYIGSTKCPASSPPKNYYTKGCYEKVKETVEDYSLICFIVFSIIFFVEVASVVSAFILVKAANRVGSGVPSPSNTQFDSNRVSNGHKPVRY